MNTVTVTVALHPPAIAKTLIIIDQGIITTTCITEIPHNPTSGLKPSHAIPSLSSPHSIEPKPTSSAVSVKSPYQTGYPTGSLN
jgi:hypothetical protein